ncbi:TPA: aminotransferase class I/II-fold pyridoxal phosphate-dependent enzyme [Candidatus Thalassarchaeaceae archaeon]|nr:MAG TPA: aminotransferase class I/II-fold pyridoxal phosphate-dependent enzyme [Candidatus Poseidoniales archaeon]HII42906.1 aminotransferase class I/II-fold pyridoxal phosphate-dependent enzyme [Candidatus Thalassarchaeaceae archaeon]
MVDFQFFDSSESEKFSEIWNQISELRYRVYSDELKQYENNQQQVLVDPGKYFITCLDNQKLIGYVSLNPHSTSGFRISKYFSDEIMYENIFSNLVGGVETTYEVRALTVDPNFRGQKISEGLMIQVLNFLYRKGGTDIVAMGHIDVLGLYKKIGMEIFEKSSIFVGDAEFKLMHMDISEAIKKYNHLIELDNSDDICYHGGASWDTSGFDFELRDSLIVADVLDSPFPPCPDALDIIRNQLERCCQESPPTHSEELVNTISNVRNVDKDDIIVSSGSSSLMFSCLPRLLDKDSKVLILSPMYGEYEHILKHVIGCEITIFPLFEDQGFIIDSKDLVSISREHDAVILVNPNSPTGVYSDAIKNIVLEINDTDFSSKCKFIWVDETYIDYVDESESLEGLVSDVDNLIICKSMSKCYALSGLRVAYIVSQKSNYLRKYIPPWSVSLPAQLAAISALNNPDYYQNKYHIIHFEREKFSQGLTEIGFKVFPGVANFLLTTLPIDSNYSSSSFITESRNLGLFVRDAENMGVTLTNKSVRFAIRSSEENNRMLSLVRKIIMKDQ